MRKSYELAILAVQAAEEIAERNRAESVYPEDIRDKAKRAAIEICGFDSSVYDWTIIAQLIMDERERCANIAEEWSEYLIWGDGKPKRLGDEPNIASAIRSKV